MVRLPSLNALHAFERVARLGSVRAAASALHVTSSAVSHQLKRLEDELGVALLERTSKGLTLTEEGQTFYEDLQGVFERIAEASTRVQRRSEQNTVTVTTLPVFSIKWLVRRLADFHSRFPSIEVRVSTTYKPQHLRTGGYDLGIRWGSGRWSGLTSVHLMHDAVQPVCSPSFFQLHGPLNPQKGLPDQNLIHMSTAREEWASWRVFHGLAAQSKSGGLQFGEPTSAIQAAIDGLGVVLAPLSLVASDLQSGLLVPAHPQVIQLSDAYYLVHPNQNRLTKPAQLFKDWMIDQCAIESQVVKSAEVCWLGRVGSRGL